MMYVKQTVLRFAVICSSGLLASAEDIAVPGDFVSIQEAIDAAIPGDTILVAPGRYAELLNFQGKDVAVRSTGGFAQTTVDGGSKGTVVMFENGETAAAVLEGFTITGGLGLIRPAGGIYCGLSSPTIVSCLIVGNVGQDQNAGAGGLQCGFAAPELRDCIFRRNLGAPSPSLSEDAGPGAVRLRFESSPLFLGCVFEENSGAPGFSPSGDGGAGAVRAESGSLARFTNCEFRLNSGGDAGAEGGVAGDGAVNLFSEPAIFRNCLFDRNAAGRGRDGAGVASTSGGGFFTNCVFLGNRGSWLSEGQSGRTGAGAINVIRGTPQVAGCEFRSNVGLGLGAPGAIFCDEDGRLDVFDSSFIGNRGGSGPQGAPGAVWFNPRLFSDPRIEGCLFEGNVGGDGVGRGGPGALSCVFGGTVENCTFVGNRGGVAVDGDGGPGGIRCRPSARTLIQSCLVVQNVGGEGIDVSNPNAADGGVGGIEISGDVIVRNCIIANNLGGSSLEFSGGPGGIESDSSGQPQVIHCTIVGNVAGTGPGVIKPSGIRFTSGVSEQVVNSILWNDPSVPEVTGVGQIRNSIVRGGFNGPTNFDADPLLVDPIGGDYRLRCASPARDAGTFDADIGEFDFEGTPRPTGPGVDIGADEFDAPAAGSSFCVASPNSTGMAALIDARGCNEISDGILPLSAGPVPDTSGAFFYGAMPVQIPFANGTRCVGGTIFRLPLGAIQGGELATDLDYTSPPQPAGQITAGSTWYFQGFYRDPAAGGAQANLTDGLQVTFVP